MDLKEVINSTIVDLLVENNVENNIDFTDTPQFRSWFGNSKVVNRFGEPLPVYHGTPLGGIENFKVKGDGSTLSSGLKEFGIFFTTSVELAKKYKTTRRLNPEFVEKIKREIERLKNIMLSTRNSTEYYEYDDEIKKLERKLSGGIYQSYLKIENPYIFNAKGKDGYYGWKELKVDIGYKTAVGIDAVEALAGHNHTFNSEYDGIIGKNIVDLHLHGADATLPEYRDFVGDVYMVFSESQILIEKDLIQSVIFQ